VRGSQRFFGQVLIIEIIIGVGLSFALATYLTRPISKLTGHIDTIIADEFKIVSLAPVLTQDEIGKLTENFNKMLMLIGQNLTLIRRKNAEMEGLYNEVTDNIKTARFIQESILPSQAILNQLFSEYFTLYLPKDIVSGDLYWADRKNGWSIMAIVDCTGHGVAGAFMTLIAYANLTEVLINWEGQLDAAGLLDKLNHRIIKVLEKEDRDYVRNLGMDVSLVCYHPGTKQLHFAGGHQHLYLMRQGEVLLTRSNRFSIGMPPGNQPVRTFTNHSLQLQSGDAIYLFSDGFADQLGGPDGNEKFKKFRLLELLMANQHLSMEAQRNLLSATIAQWMDKRDQLDDIVVFGLKIT
jgi:serine phosphatase RsbU (regulator of sigma subunit)